MGEGPGKKKEFVGEGPAINNTTLGEGPVKMMGGGQPMGMQLPNCVQQEIVYDKGDNNYAHSTQYDIHFGSIKEFKCLDFHYSLQIIV